MNDTGKNMAFDVRYGSTTDIGLGAINVRFWGKRCYEAEGSGFKLLRLFHRR